MPAPHAASAAVAVLLAAAVPGAARAADVAPGVGPAESLTALPDRAALTARGSVYVPAYSSVPVDRGQARINLSVTLSVRNASAEAPLVIERIAYRNISGGLVQDYLSGPVAVRPFGTLEVQVPIRDTRGGTSAAFVVDWAAAGPIAEPVIETLNLGAAGTQGYSFVSQGRPIRVPGAASR